jgi:hypothetical protein
MIMTIGGIPPQLVDHGLLIRESGVDIIIMYIWMCVWPLILYIYIYIYIIHIMCVCVYSSVCSSTCFLLLCMYLRIYLYCNSVCVFVQISKWVCMHRFNISAYLHVKPSCDPCRGSCWPKKSQVDHPKSDSKHHQLGFGNHLVGKLNS